MKKQDAYKLLAAFMILIMIIVPVAYVMTSPRSDINQETQNPSSGQEKYNPDLWVINQPFYSISDALNMTPVGAISASYADLESMTPQMVQWTKSVLPVNEVDSLYKSNTTKMYYATLPSPKEGVPNFLLLSTMFPEKNDFDYIVLPNTTNILRRQDTGAINILGNPIIYTVNDKTTVDVLTIINSLNKTNTSYDKYQGLLSNVDEAPFQEINSNVTFADQFYMGVKETSGNYERTTVYLNANSSTLKKLNQLKTGSTQKGFAQYSIIRNGNYTVVKIGGPDMFTVLSEESS
ncbi:Uncharacterised protein [uncultured archaeon]|nr:Uncharacterised protein [uncultured archaeon]